MTFGMIVLLVLTLLVIFGVGQRVLDRMRLSDKGALGVMLAIFIGGLIPAIPIGNIRIGVGGCIIPLLICIYLLVKAERGVEVFRAILGGVLTAAAIWLMGLWLPAEPENIFIDPNYLYGIAAGVIAYILGRSRRGAFVSAVFGVLLSDALVAIINWSNGVDSLMRLGTAGALDMVVISGLIAVLLAEFVGEAIERMVRGRRREGAK